MAWKRKRKRVHAPESAAPRRQDGFDWPARPVPTAVSVIKRPTVKPPVPEAQTRESSGNTDTDLWDELDRLTEDLVGELRSELSVR